MRQLKRFDDRKRQISPKKFPYRDGLKGKKSGTEYPFTPEKVSLRAILLFMKCYFDSFMQ